MPEAGAKLASSSGKAEPRPAAGVCAADPGPHRGREVELDFVRGLAILLVLDFHAPVHWMTSPLRLLGFPNFGWAGVDVFFVLSGFLVGGLLVKEWRTKGQIDHRRFLVRRGFKIWPQYYVFLLLMIVTGHRPFRELMGNLLNVQNYVGGVPHTWSLAVEEHAYLLLAFGMAWAARARVRVRTLVVVLTGLTVLVVGGRLILAQHGFEVTTRTHTRIEGILYGVLLAVVFHYRPALFQALQMRRWIWLAMLGVSLVYLRFQPAGAWGSSLGWDAANLLGIALLMLLYRSHRVRQPGPLYRLIAWIGVYSYGIYLWHVSVITPSLALAGKLPAVLVPATRAVLPVVAGVLVGAAFTKAVEMPALRLRDRWFPRGTGSPVRNAGEPERTERPPANLAASQQTPQVAGV